MDISLTTLTRVQEHEKEYLTFWKERIYFPLSSTSYNSSLSDHVLSSSFRLPYRCVSNGNEDPTVRYILNLNCGLSLKRVEKGTSTEWLQVRYNYQSLTTETFYDFHSFPWVSKWSLRFYIFVNRFTWVKGSEVIISPLTFTRVEITDYVT